MHTIAALATKSTKNKRAHHARNTCRCLGDFVVVGLGHVLHPWRLYSPLVGGRFGGGVGASDSGPQAVNPAKPSEA